MRYAIIMGDVVFCCELDEMPQDLLNRLNQRFNAAAGPFMQTYDTLDELTEISLEQWHCGDIEVIEGAAPMMEGKPVAKWAQHTLLWTATGGFYFERCLSGDCGNCNCG
jgi:hypothetical protein